MTWGAPVLAAIAAAVIIPALVLLYFLKLRRRDVEISSTLLWKKAIEDLQANAPFQRLRNNILLILQLLALAAALLALAQPMFDAQRLQGRRHIILIDRSASMGAADAPGEGGAEQAGGPTRLDRARERANAIVEALREPGVFAGGESGDLAMVIAFGQTAEVVQNFTSSKAELRAAIESIEPSDSPASLREALRLAKAYTPRVVLEDRGLVLPGEPATLHLVSDGALPDAAEASIDPEFGFEFHAVGDPGAINLGITAISARRAYDEPGKVQLFIEVRSTDPSPREAVLQIGIEGQSARLPTVRVPGATVETVPLEPESPGGEPRSLQRVTPGVGGVVVPLDLPGAAVVTAQLAEPGPDVLDRDNVAYLIIPPARRQRVALVSEGSLVLDTALRALTADYRGVIEPARYQSMLEAGQTADLDVVVLDRFLPRTGQSPAGGPEVGLPPGRSLVLGAVPVSPAGLREAGEMGASVVVDWERRHPALRYAGLESLTVAEARRAEVLPDAPAAVLALGQEGPLLLELRGPRHHALITTFDPVTASDWPFNWGFVPFLAGAIDYLGGQDAGDLEALARPGGTISERLPAGVRDVSITLPDGSRRPLTPSGDGRVVFGPLAAAGIYTISWTGPAGASDVTSDGRAFRAIAVNLADADETNLPAVQTLPLASRIVLARDGGRGEGALDLWPWLLGLCLALVLLEWFVYNRKVRL